MAEALIQTAGPIRLLLANKGYDADHLKRHLAAQGTEAVIAHLATGPIPSGVLAYKDRTASSAWGAGSSTSAASPPDTTRWPGTPFGVLPDASALTDSIEPGA